MLGVNAKQLTKLLKAQNETTKQSNQIGVSTEFGPYRAVRNFVEF